jgi:hypothetical protein
MFWEKLLPFFFKSLPNSFQIFFRLYTEYQGKGEIKGVFSPLPISTTTLLFLTTGGEGGVGFDDSFRPAIKIDQIKLTRENG